MGNQLWVWGLLFSWLYVSETGQPFPTVAPKLHFHCNTGYIQRDCEVQLSRLRRVLGEMDLTGLGEWTWVLVKSEDWTPILRRVDRDQDSPAFTILEKRQTFLEEALFNPPADRGRTLLAKWRMPLDELLPFAVAHELGHALCREVDERRANDYAAQLRSAGTVRCRTR
jgi:hypothetical protein